MLVNPCLKETGVNNFLNLYTLSHVIKLCNVNMIFIANFDYYPKRITPVMKVGNHNLNNDQVQAKSFMSRNFN